MKKIKIGIIAVFVFLLPSIMLSQISKQDSIWKPFKFFIGNWTGTNEGSVGNGVYERSYKFIFNGKFIEVKNKSTYSPTAENPKGEVHEDVGYISYDKIRKIFILRQFHIEGFVNQYKLDSISPDKRTIIFITESIENIAPGWRAKESYQLINDNEFIESFELAEPNKDFEGYSKATLKRKNM